MSMANDQTKCAWCGGCGEHTMWCVIGTHSHLLRGLDRIEAVASPVREIPILHGPPTVIATFPGRIVSLVEYKGRLFVATETGVFVKDHEDHFVPLEFETLPPADRKPFMADSQGFTGDDSDFAEVDAPQDTLSGAVFVWESTAREFVPSTRPGHEVCCGTRAAIDLEGMRRRAREQWDQHHGHALDRLAGMRPLPEAPEPVPPPPFKPAKFGEHGGR